MYTRLNASTLPRRAIVFGGLGTLGDAIAHAFADGGADVVRTSHSRDNDSQQKLVRVDPFGDGGLGALDSIGQFDAAVWAQGVNVNDSVVDLDIAAHRRLYEVNCIFVSVTLARLLQNGGLVAGGRCCVLSSIWQLIARRNKFSYCVSKAALGGLIRSAAVDLGERGILINAVLPGAVDSPMTSSVLSNSSITEITRATPLARLAKLEDLTSLILYLCSPDNTGVTGQSIAVDLGFTIARQV